MARLISDSREVTRVFAEDWLVAAALVGGRDHTGVVAMSVETRNIGTVNRFFPNIFFIAP